MKTTAYFDVYHISYLVTHLSVNGPLVYINYNPIKWYLRRKNTVDTSTYGFELVAARLTIEISMYTRYNIRMIWYPLMYHALCWEIICLWFLTVPCRKSPQKRKK